MEFKIRAMKNQNKKKARIEKVCFLYDCRLLPLLWGGGGEQDDNTTQ